MIGLPDLKITGKNDTAYYDIITDYGHDIDPVYTKELIFRFDNDSLVIDYKIREWEKK